MNTVLDRDLEYVVPFTYSTVPESTQHPLEPRLSTLSWLSIFSATEVANLNSSGPSIAVAGENVWKVPGASTPELMGRWALRIARPAHSINIVDKDAANTAIQVRSLKKWFKQVNPSYEPIALVHDYHVERTRRYVKQVGAHIGVASIRDVLAEAEILDEYPILDHLQAFEARERVLNNPLHKLADWHGAASALLAKIQSPQIHDIAATDGDYETISTTVKKFLATS